MWSLALAARISTLLQTSCFASLMTSFWPWGALGYGLCSIPPFDLVFITSDHLWMHWSLLTTYGSSSLSLPQLLVLPWHRGGSCHHSWPKAFLVDHNSLDRTWQKTTTSCIFPCTGSTSGTTMNPSIPAVTLAALLLFAHLSGSAPDHDIL